MFAGSVNTGGVVSTTVTVNVPRPTLPAASLALQVTIVAPSANASPEAGPQLTATGPSTSSIAVARNVTTAPAGPTASAVILAGRLSTGGVPCTTATPSSTTMVSV